MSFLFYCFYFLGLLLVRLSIRLFGFTTQVAKNSSSIFGDVFTASNARASEGRRGGTKDDDDDDHDDDREEHAHSDAVRRTCAEWRGRAGGKRIE